MVSDILPGRLTHIRDIYQIATAEKNAEVAAWADVILLAVEPQVLDEVLREIASVVDDSKLVLSVAAGYPLARLQRYLPGTRRIVRAMPNTPSSIREGITALAYAAELADEDVRTVKALFGSIGKVVEVAERALDAVTGLSGSGPAYVYVMIEALADGGVKMGLPRATAELLAAQTVAGSACMVVESKEHPGTLKDRVASLTAAGRCDEVLIELTASGEWWKKEATLLLAAGRCHGACTQSLRGSRRLLLCLGRSSALSRATPEPRRCRIPPASPPPCRDIPLPPFRVRG